MSKIMMITVAVILALIAVAGLGCGSRDVPTPAMTEEEHERRLEQLPKERADMMRMMRKMEETKDEF